MNFEASGERYINGDTDTIQGVLTIDPARLWLTGAAESLSMEEALKLKTSKEFAASEFNVEMELSVTNTHCFANAPVP